MYIITTIRVLQLAAVAVAAALLGGEGGAPASSTGFDNPGRICPPGWKIYKYDYLNVCYERQPNSSRFNEIRPNCNCVPASICTAADTEPAWANERLCGKSGRVCCFNFTEAYPRYDIANTKQTCGLSLLRGNAMKSGEARTFEWPSVVAVLDVTAGRTWSPSELVATGVLINRRVVLTTAHKLANINAKEIKVRMYQYNSQRPTLYFLKDKEAGVEHFIVHPRYERPTLAFDAALLFLKETISSFIACLASSPPQPDTGCHVTGWGQRAVGGAYATRLKKVAVPIVGKVQCEEALSHTRYRRVRLHQSTVCAGGRAGEDACRGDGGAPLLCPIEGTNYHGKPRYFVAGLVSWGVGCGEPGLPGVYTNVASLFIWITDTIQRQGIDNP